jgi:adenosylcobinamide amidohydrolase
MSWHVLTERPTFVLRRRGRFLIAELVGDHRVLSTSPCHGGQTSHVRFIVNHQSCEGRGHDEHHRAITDGGDATYHDRTCAEAEVPGSETVTMGTAANMNYAAVTTMSDGDVEVTAVVTAGVESNATCAGDPAAWREAPSGVEKVPLCAGTINTMLLASVPLTDGALARAVVTMTEGKSAALQRLAIPSRQSRDLATGTGTDQYAIAAPVTGTPAFKFTGAHVKLGELIGRATCDATVEALRWQNGLEPSYTRGLFHALGRYGLVEKTFLDDIRPFLGNADLELLEKNMKAVLYEPMAGAAAHALAAVLDRVRHGSLPPSAKRDACVQQAALLAANLAAKPDAWPHYRSRLADISTEEPQTLILAAIALGWSGKWR